MRFHEVNIIRTNIPAGNVVSREFDVETYKAKGEYKKVGELKHPPEAYVIDIDGNGKASEGDLVLISDKGMRNPIPQTEGLQSKVKTDTSNDYWSPSSGTLDDIDITKTNYEISKEYDNNAHLKEPAFIGGGYLLMRINKMPSKFSRAIYEVNLPNYRGQRLNEYGNPNIILPDGKLLHLMSIFRDRNNLKAYILELDSYNELRSLEKEAVMFGEHNDIPGAVLNDIVKDRFKNYGVDKFESFKVLDTTLKLKDGSYKKALVIDKDRDGKPSSGDLALLDYQQEMNELNYRGYSVPYRVSELKGRDEFTLKPSREEVVKLARTEDGIVAYSARRSLLTTMRAGIANFAEHVANLALSWMFIYGISDLARREMKSEQKFQNSQ